MRRACRQRADERAVFGTGFEFVTARSIPRL
jgi:hypothetical protein